jgi:hypothetical protein
LPEARTGDLGGNRFGKRALSLGREMTVDGIVESAALGGTVPDLLRYGDLFDARGFSLPKAILGRGRC